jgi:hypothetical protein
MKEPTRWPGITFADLNAIPGFQEEKIDPAAVRIHTEELVASTGDPIAENPFPFGSARHGEWRTATLVAEEKYAELCALYIGKPGSHLATQEFSFTVSAYCIWALRGEAAIQSDADLKAFDKWLVDYADSFFVRFARYGNADTIHRGLQEGLRSQLTSLVQAYKGRARAALRRYEATHGRQKSEQPPDARPSKEVVRARNERVARYRREHDLTWKAFVLGIGMSESGIRGAIRGDRSRYGEDTLRRLLRTLGITVEMWDSPTDKP